jgi:hypothetical protein
MKTIKKIIKYSFVIFFLSSSSCDGSDEQEIPTGDHSFYCYIDGDLFVPKGNPNISTSPTNDGYTFYKWENNTTVIAKDYNKFTVFFNTLSRDLGEKELENSSGSFLDYSINHAIVKKNGVKYLSKDNSGTIVFTENTENNVKGTFEFTLYNENDESDTIQITNGHFDD